jgi:hypothetical protein
MEGRQDTPGVLLTPRDRRLLEHVSRIRVLDTQQAHVLEEQAFPNDRTVARRMLTLAKHGYLAYLPNQDRRIIDPQTSKLSGRKPGIYALGSQATRLFARMPDVRWARKNRQFRNDSIEHARGISWVYTAFTRALRPGGPFPNLECSGWLQGDVLRRRFCTRSGAHGVPELITSSFTREEAITKGFRVHSVAPDAYFRIIRKDQRTYVPVFLEYDRNSMSNGRFATKIAHYVLWKKFKLHEKDQVFRFPWFVVLTVTHDKGHLEFLLQACLEELQRLKMTAEASYFRFCLLDQFKANVEEIPRPIWRIPGGGEKRFRPYE